MRSLEVKTPSPMCSVTAANTTTSEAFKHLCEVQTYLDAFEYCKHSSLWKNSTQTFERDRLKESLRLAQAVADGSYAPAKYKEFDIYERGKKRHIKAPSIKDRVFCHALCQDVLLPRILPTLIYDNSASIKGKGISFARKRMLTHLHRYHTTYGTNVGYVLQTDFSSFFDSIDHELLLKSFFQYVPEPEIQRLITVVTKSFSNSEKGLGIGSELSQLAGILFPAPVDTWCKTVKQCRFYARYMDDIYVIHPDKDFLWDVYEDMQRIAEELKLSFNPKKCHISRLDKGFCHLKGVYQLLPTGRVLCSPCRKTLARVRKRFKAMANKPVSAETYNTAFNSWYGDILKQFPTVSRKTMTNFKEVCIHDLLYL